MKKNGVRKKIAIVVGYFFNSDYIFSLIALLEHDLSVVLVIHKSHLCFF
jgi:hypothetical protein